jgi:hypothetical protein
MFFLFDQRRVGLSVSRANAKINPNVPNQLYASQRRSCIFQSAGNKSNIHRVRLSMGTGNIRENRENRTANARRAGANAAKRHEATRGPAGAALQLVQEMVGASHQLAAAFGR